MSPDPDLHALLHDPALALAAPEALADGVRTRARRLRRRRSGAAGGAVLVAALGIALGPGLPDSLVPADRRGPAALAETATPAPAVRLHVSSTLPVGALDAAATACTRLPGVRDVQVLESFPVQVSLTVAGAQLAAVQGCLEQVPGLVVTRA